MQKQPWQIWIDTGGTFTDCIAMDPRGKIRRVKVLSNATLRGEVIEKVGPAKLSVRYSCAVARDFVKGFDFRLLNTTHDPVRISGFDPDSGLLTFEQGLDVEIATNTPFEVGSPEEAPILAARLVTQTTADEPLPHLNMRLATTRGTNALLERKGVDVVLFITSGFADLLEIGTQQRPDIFALDVRKPAPLQHATVEVPERLSAEGDIISRLNPDDLQSMVTGLLDDGIKVAAVALMHSYKNPAHEYELAGYLRSIGFEHISISAELSPFIKLLPRAETALIDAYLSPLINNYLNGVAGAIPAGRLHVMTSAGGLIDAQEFHAKDSLLSGPAGGVVGAALAGVRSGFRRLIAFDMGGTSTDVARIDGDFEYTFEHSVAGIDLAGPALAIESVAAGGGSICSFDGYRLRVGPESAGAYPGPACYGAGGPLTLTDVNLLLGRLSPERFEIPISKSAAHAELMDLMSSIRQRRDEQASRNEQASQDVQASQNEQTPQGERTSEEEILQGFLEIADERMSDAIRRVSIRKGYDVRDHVLVSFGGAGGQHACVMAEKLEIKKIVVPLDASLLSAWGLGHAVVERIAERQILKRLSGIGSEITDILQSCARQAKAAVLSEGFASEEIEVRRQIVNLRFVGQDSSLSIDLENDSAGEKAKTGADVEFTLAQMFSRKYREVFGHLPEGREIEVESIRIVCSTISQQQVTCGPVAVRYQAIPDGRLNSFFNSSWQKLPFFERENLRSGALIDGPTLIFERHSTTIVDESWRVEVDSAGALILASGDEQES